MCEPPVYLRPNSHSLYTKDAGSNNFFKAPADVTRWVRIAGYLTLALSVPLFQDLLDSIETIHEGYHPVVMKQTPHATFK